VVALSPAEEAAAPELSASRNARTEVATLAESTDLAARVASGRGRPCRIASQREREEPSQEEDRQTTASIPCVSHGYSYTQPPCHPSEGGGTREGIVTSRDVSPSG